jgi:glycerol-3-phosphate dehydrogenase subunit B
MEYDVIVIGAGPAGLMAAEAAQSRGACVAVLAKGMGSFPLTSGCIDGLGYFPTNSAAPLSSPFSGLDNLRKLDPEHPYSKVSPEALLESFARLQKIVEDGGLPYAGNLKSNFLLATPLGTFHPTCLAPVTMEQGDLRDPGSVLLVGVEGLKDFNPFWAAENLNLLHAQGRISPVFRPTMLKIDLAAAPMNALNLSRAFDDPLIRERAAGKLKALLQPGERVGLPAVLGLHAAREAWLDLQKKTGAKIFEIPLPPPSVPGIRLYNMLRGHLQGRGVRVIIGLSSLKPIVQGNRISGLMLGERRSPHYRARSFVLASGSFVGGGLDSDRSAIRETLFDLPSALAESEKSGSTEDFFLPRGSPSTDSAWR